MTDRVFRHVMKKHVYTVLFSILASCLGFAAGDVVGPASATSNAIARFDGTTGKLIKNSSAATLSDAGELNLTVPAGLNLHPLLITQAFTGTSASTVGENMNWMYTSSDNAAMPSGTFLNNFRIDHNFGGSSMVGGRQSFFVNASQTTPSSSSNVLTDYVAISAWISSQQGDGGTAQSPKGDYYALNPFAVLTSGATYVHELTGAEFNIAAQSGSSVYYKTILSLVGHNTDAVRGYGYDAMLSLSNQGGVGWKDGILFSAANSSHPIGADGTLIRSVGGSVANGIDISGTTISGSAFKSPGFTLDGSGTVSLNHLFLGTGASAYLMSNDSADLYVGTHGAKTMYFVTGNTIRGAMTSSGAVVFNAGLEGTTVGAASPSTGSFSTLRVNSAPPSSSGSAATAGQMTWDSNYLYVCVATNTWKRVALSSW